MNLNKQEIETWLRETNSDRLSELWQMADRVRRRSVGDAVHMRGLVEISNHCRRRCGYCGLQAGNSRVPRYRMSAIEIRSSAAEAFSYGFGTVVLQAGEDTGIEGEWLADIIRTFKRETGLAVTLSLGERNEEELALWREAGADRYLLRFETSNRDLFRAVHPPLKGAASNRFDLLRHLRELGYETGSGVLIGLPGQSYNSLAEDICMFAELDLDMVGSGPFIPHPDTLLGRGLGFDLLPPEEQVPNTALMGYKVLALTRIVCPEANLPCTTALTTLNTNDGLESGLMRGANVIMMNLTPLTLRPFYEIYPEKSCFTEEPAETWPRLKNILEALERSPGRGPGGRKHGLG
ncbi:MAG: [FeFe] hydrogenase H-cluster radical SAM maturase HydE [Deltaproteobacteria bacterium]|nr:[FeFe] hydrogenase H-cluster radical SAM maturase HydE [Deltaproteobacteria bacterium]